MHDDAVDQQDLQQHRNVAGEFDETIDDAAHEPVRRQPKHAENEAEDRCQDHTAKRHQKRVEDADDHRPEVTARRGILDQRLVDVVVRGFVQKIEAEGLAKQLQVRDRVGRNVCDECDEERERQNLQDDASRFLVVPEPGDKVPLPAICLRRSRRRFN